MRLRQSNGPERTSRPDRWIFLCLAGLLVWLPLPWGSRSQVAIAFFGAVVLALVAARLALIRRTALPAVPHAARWSLWLCAGWLGWIALQLLPLPAPVLMALSERAAEAHYSLLGVDRDPGVRTLSLLPGSTVDQWLLSAALVAVFWLVLVTVAHNRKRQRWLLFALLASGLGQALYGIVMTLSGWEIGFFAQKAHGIGYATGTFVNKNHFASYLGLTLAAGVALVLADLRPKPWASWRDAFGSLSELALSPRFRVRVALAVIVIALVLTRSRMGNGAFFTALAVCGAVYVLIRHRRYFLPSLALFASIFLVDLWIVSDRYGLEKLAQRIEETRIETEGRAEVLPDMAPLARRYVLTGSGLGTFAAAYSPERSDDVKAYYNHAHNDHLEFLVEAGVPGYAILVALAVLTLRHGLKVIRRRNDPMAAALAFAGCMALVCAGLNGLTDFSLRIPAIAATLAALVALALSCSSVPHREGPAPVLYRDPSLPPDGHDKSL